MSLRVRILLVAAPPLIGMLLLAGVTTVIRWQHSQDMAHVVQLSTLVDSIGALTQQLQSERGVVGVFLNSGGAEFRDDLLREQYATALREMDFQVKARDLGTTNPLVSAKLAQAQMLMQRSADFWQRTNDLTLKPDDSFAFYDDLIQSLLDVTPELAITAQDSGAARSFLALFNFLEMEEHAGQEEAIGAAGFAMGEFSPQLLRQFNFSQREQNSSLQMFRSYATVEELALLPLHLSTAAIATVNRLRSLADAVDADGKLHVSSTVWLAAATARIDELRLVEMDLTQHMQDRAMANSQVARHWLYLAAEGIAAMTALVIAVALATIRSLALPLRRLTHTMTALAGGNTSVQVPASNRTDEIGDMARALVVLRDNRIAAELQQAERVADRAMQERRQLRIGVRITAFGTAVAGALQGLDAAGLAMLNTSGRLSGTASRSALRSASAVIAVGQASINAAAVATAVATLAASAEEIGREAGAATVKITHATRQARQTDSMVASLAVAAEQVGSVVSLVRAMATKTNMLALNATIEASRAGDAGRGFAVVASEVKALASQTNQATAAIAGQIAAIQAAALEGSTAVQSIARSVDDAGAAALAVAAAVKVQSTATGEITRYAHEIAQGANQLQEGMSNANVAAAATGQEASAVRDAAEVLGQQAGILRLEIEDFLAEIQAA